MFFWLFHRFDNKTIQYTEVCRTEELKTTYQLFISLRNLYYFRAFAVEGINCTVTTIDSSFEAKWFLIFILWLRTQRFAGFPCLAFFHSWRLFLSTNPAFLSWDLSMQGKNAQMNVHRRFCFSLNLFPSIFSLAVVYKVKIKRSPQNAVTWSHAATVLKEHDFFLSLPPKDTSRSLKALVTSPTCLLW